MGNDTGLSHAEQRTHFALWALLKSPLMIGHDLRDFSKTSLGILLAKVGPRLAARAMCGWRECWVLEAQFWELRCITAAPRT